MRDGLAPLKAGGAKIFLEQPQRKGLPFGWKEGENVYMNPIKVVSYGRSLIEELAKELVEKYWNPKDPLSLVKVTVIFPHRRPKIYLRHQLKELIKKPFIPPRTYSLEEFITELSLKIEDPPQKVLSIPDRVWLLFHSLNETKAFKGIQEEFTSFFPWGVRLVGLFEEFYKEMIKPASIQYPLGVHPKAQEFLEDLSEIFTCYEEALKANGFTTPGRRLNYLAQKAKEIPVNGQNVFIVGFYALTEAENLLFRSLWEKGARVFWQAEENLPPLYKRWQNLWKAELEFIKAESNWNPTIHFISAYDLHSQLSKVREILEKEKDEKDTAIVLPDPSALMPLLYELPEDQDVNITLGYPLERTAIWGLIDQLMKLQENFDPQRGYYYRDYLSIIRHPFLKRLKLSADKTGQAVLHLLESKIREKGKPYLTLEEIEELVESFEEKELFQWEIKTEEAKRFLSEIHQTVISIWKEMGSLKDLCKGIEKILNFFEKKQIPPKEYSLEEEFIYTFREELLLTLKDSLFFEEKIDQKLLFELLRELVSFIRTPFEGEPLVKLQVLGLLETRLLKFDRVFVIDVNEGILPPSEEVDPLLPSSFRPVLGLPEREREEEIIWYHFQRLIRSAKEVYLLWQSNVLSQDKGELKMERSRFVERLLWEEEKKKGRLLEDEIEKISLNLCPAFLSRKKEIPKKDKEKLKLKLFSISQKRGLSASLFQTYMECPIEFYYRYILELKPPEEAIEEMEGDVLGEVIHRTLEEYFKPYVGTTYDPSKHHDPERIFRLFLSNLNKSHLQHLAEEKKIFIKEAVKYRLESYLNSIDTPTNIIDLEKELSLKVRLLDTEWNLFGRIDRIDKIKDTFLIIDYKTGSEAKEKFYFSLRIPETFDYESLKELKKNLNSIQLRYYIFLFTEGGKKDVEKVNAAYVNLGIAKQDADSNTVKKKEIIKYFIEPKKLEITTERVSYFQQKFPKLLGYLLKHILESPSYYSSTDPVRCSFCEYEPYCLFSH